MGVKYYPWIFEDLKGYVDWLDKYTFESELVSVIVVEGKIVATLKEEEEVYL